MGQNRTENARWKKTVGILGGVILGCVLIIAAFGKAADPLLFVEHIRNEALDFFLSGNSVALITVALEMALGVALLSGVRSLWILLPSSLLVAFFLFLNGQAYWLVVTGQRENTYECGCFGVFLSRTVTEAFWQDLFLLLPPLLMCFVGRQTARVTFSGWRLAAVILSTVLILAYIVVIPGLPEEVLPAEPPQHQLGSGALQITREFALFVSDVEDPSAEIYQSESTMQFIILSSKLSFPVVLDLRQNAILGASLGMLSRNPDNTLDLDPSFAPEKVGGFEIGPQGPTFVLKGERVEMRNRE
jgi:hypothetical protein